MWKLIFLGLLIWLAIYIVKRLTHSGTRNQSGKGQSDEDSIENMVQCRTCHVHLPRSEAFLIDGDFYCCKAHIKNK